MTLKKLLAKVDQTYGTQEVDGKLCVPDWVRTLVTEAYHAGQKEARIDLHAHVSVALWSCGTAVHDDLMKRIFGKEA